MTFDAGRIEATAHLNNTPFRQGLVELQRLGKEAERPVSVPVRADTGDAEGKLIRLEERLKRISGEDVTPNIDVQGLARANTELSILEARMHRMSRGGGSAGGGAGGGGFLGALGRAGSHAPGMLPLALGAAAPLAVPAAGLLAGAGAGLLTPLGAGAIGAGIFGAAAKSSIQTVQKDVQKLTQLTNQYNAATTNKQRAAVLAKEQALWKGLDPAQRAAVKNVQTLDESWKRFQHRLEPQSFAALAGGAKVATTGLNYLLPTARFVGNEIADLEKRAQHAFTQPFWHQFFGNFLPGEAARAVDTFGTAFGHLLSGGAHLMQAFAPLGHDLENVIVRLTGKFDTWTQGGGPVRFVNWVEKNGPGAAKALEGLAHGMEGLGKGLSPIAAVELKALTPVLNFIGDLGDQHPAVITAVGAALLTVGGGLKAIQAAKGLGSVGSTIKGLLLGGGGGPGGRGGTPASPLYVWDVNGSGGGGIPPVGGKKGPLGNLPVLGLPLTAAYLATQGGDVAPGQTHYVSGGSDAKALSDAIHQLVMHFPGGDFAKAPKVATQLYAASYNRTGGQTSVNIPSAVAFLQKYGNSAQLDALAKKYPQIAAAVKEASRQENVLNHYLSVNTGLAAASAAAQTRAAASIRRAFAGIPAWVKAAENAASSGGFQIGKNLTAGIIIGIRQGQDKVALQMVSVVNGALHAGRTTAKLGSPSKITTQYGRWIAEGLAVGFAQQIPQVEALFSKRTAGALRTIAGIAASRLASARQQLSTDQQAKAGYVSQLQGQFMPGVAGAFNQAGGVDSISGYFSGAAGTNQRLLGDLRTLQGRHLAPAIIRDILEQGPQQGLNLAESILLGNSGSIASINKNYATDLASAKGLAAFGGNLAYGSTVARDQHLVDVLTALVHELRTHPEVVVKINDREIARANRTGTAKNKRR